MGGRDLTVSLKTGPSAPATDSAVALRRGSVLSRYLVIDAVGSGGAGSVFAAYDTQLDRRVALKVLHRNVASDEAWGRVVREARALAKLAHPNVLTVFDVGSEDDVAYIAMELVEGRDLARHLAERVENAGWRPVLPLFLQAARGLAAAHEAGIVHGDFKPANCLVGSDGRLRVSDFGLARAAATTDTTPADAGSPSQVLETAERNGTDPAAPPGGGTPYFMAPEQHDGARADARSDVFSFCVSLYEAIHARAPFEAKTIPGLAQLKRDGPPKPPPGAPRVPARLRNLIDAGLHPDPQRRPASMVEVVRALEQSAGWRSRGRFIALAGATAILGAGTGALAMSVRETEPCSDVQRHLAPVWDPQRRAALRDAFEGADPRGGAEVWSSVEATVGRYLDGWVAARTDSCRATHLGERSTALLDRSNACLDRRLAEADALLRVFASADAAMVSQARRAVGELRSVQPCADAQLLLAAVEPPPPTTREAVEALTADLDEARALLLAGKIATVVEQSDDLLERARSLAYDPLLADVLNTIAGAKMKSSATLEAYGYLREAHFAAVRAKAEPRAAEAAIDMIFLATVMAKNEEAQLWIDIAAAALARAGDDPLLEARFEANRGVAASSLGDYEAAKGHLLRAIELRSSQTSDDDAYVGWLWGTLASLASEHHHYDEGLEYILRAKANDEKNLPPDHPGHAVSTFELAMAYEGLRRYDEAEREYRRALELYAGSIGKETSAYGEVLINYGNTLADLGRYDEAEAKYAEGLAVFEASPGEDDLEQGIARMLMAQVRLERGDIDEAVELLKVGCPMIEAADPEGPEAEECAALRRSVSADAPRGRPAR